MILPVVRSLMAGTVLALAALACTAPAQAQALHPLPPDFLVTLKNIDTCSDEIAAAVTAIKNADLTYSMFARNRVYEAIARMEQQLPLLKTQTANLRREESLGMLLSTRTTFSEAQRNVGAVSDILHGVTARSPSEADTLKKLLAQLDGAVARLDTALKQFDSGAMALAGLASSVPAPAPNSSVPAPTPASSVSAPAPASSAAAPAPASPAPAQGRAPLPLPADFLVTLKNIDSSSDEIAAAVMAIKNADLTYSMFSRNRVNAAIARMEQQLPVLKTQTANLRREASPGMLLSTRTTFSEAQRNLGAVSDTLHDATVRSPSELETLKKLLAQLDGAIARLDAALKQFDSAAMALLDKPRRAR
jgi:exonuclease VII small subunit